MSMPAPSLPEMLATVKAFVQASLPGEEADEVVVLLRSGKRLRVPFSAGIVAAAPCAEPGASAFNPSEFQADLLAALEGCALRTDALAAKADCDRRRLFRPGGLKDLQAAGWVAHDPAAGYFRPDVPPEGLRGRERDTGGREG